MSKNTNESNTQQVKDPKKSRIGEEPLYFASVYRYTCLGHVRAPPNSSSSQKEDDRVCRGIQYGLTHAAESHRLISRHEATRDFAILNGTAKDRQHVSPGMPTSINNALKTQAIDMQQSNNDKVWNEVDSYGITDVEVLVLQDSKTKKSEVASVAPHTFVGNSVRDVGTHEGTIMSATVHLGPLEITLDSGVEEPEENNTHASNKPVSPQENKRAAPARRDSRRTDPVELGKKVVNNMVKGASTLKDAVSEDFPSRMYDASHRVVGQMGNTVERTGKVVKSLYRIWFDADDDQRK